jgi:DNA-binding IclR family transcriptional regulator
MLERSFAEGIATSQGDVIPSVNAIGTPLRDKQGAVFSAIALAGPARRLPSDRLREFHAMLLEIAHELEALPN